MVTSNLFAIQNNLEREILTTSVDNSKQSAISTVELFAGVGGFRLGLERASTKDKVFEVYWSNQWEPSTKTQHASDIYSLRFGSENHSNEDIATVNVDNIPNHELLVGGFPCQDYSVASTLKNAHGIVGKKGVLWWSIYKILFQKKEKSPKYLLLENVDRLLKSPASQRGRDFAIILSSLNALGYAVEWRVINSADYGMPQRRRRVFILAYKKGTKLYKHLKKFSTNELLDNELLLSKTFPIKPIDNKTLITGELSSDLVNITENFNSETPKKNAFWESGYMIDGKYYTSRVEVDYSDKQSVLGDFLMDEKDVPKEFYIDDEALKKWEYQKGAKSIERVNKATGHQYTYSEGSMGFPDALDKPSRTIITGEGGASASRFKHVVCVNGRHRRLTPIELERLNMFPDNHTEGASDSKRAFLMGNALVIGIVERIGRKLLDEI
ncbi:MAG: DNA-cytosine methyltransferase (EC [uncultured Sulfurovum sp.]|uniref:Cytosine-specific methyltransferase n=1 Tax=uncultured Sulfurovum sp. TaxID=269237 RepID=A0A6S6THZ0_9BACT|nr:MAG: DNA-cytosine methyltransferase (EC [uncultured Sulfurovum sp.]